MDALKKPVVHPCIVALYRFTVLLFSLNTRISDEVVELYELPTAYRSDYRAFLPDQYQTLSAGHRILSLIRLIVIPLIVSHY
jgi:hypothetical protein